MDCKKFQELIYLSNYDDLDEGTLKLLKFHLNSCPHCSTEKSRADKFFSLLKTQKPSEIDPQWLKSARNQLLAHLEITRKKPAKFFFDWERIRTLLRSPALQIVYSAALLTIGIMVGRFECSSKTSLIPAITAGKMASTNYSQEIPDLIQEGRLRNLDMELLPNQQLQITFEGTRNYQIVGSSQDQYMKELMAYILKNEKNDGLRMRTVEMLANEPDSLSQQMLLYSLLHDDNPGVRLKAIRSLRNYEASPQIRDVYMKILMTEPNSAVRIEAMEGLTDYINENRVREVITIAAAKDSNDYVKLLANNALTDFNQTPALSGTKIEKLK